MVLERIPHVLTATIVPKKEQKWWHRAIVYQIYPKSFQDTNGDGIGDIKGIIQRLDYIKNLGANTIWLNPIFVSPQDDNGYDIADFYDIDSTFGTLDDVKKLITEAHKRSLKIVFDLVLNHTSDEHAWFQEAKKDKNSPYHDYYIWEKGKKGKEPTNWGSFFGGSLWEYNEETDEYYMHLFSKKMPDLNWNSQKLRQEMYKIANFWTRLGIDGFRMDAIVHLEKDKTYPMGVTDGKNPYVIADQYYANLPQVHDYVQEFHHHVLEGKELVTIGEAASANIAEAIRYTNPERKELNMIVSFESTGIDRMYKEGHPPGIRDPQGPRFNELKQIMLKWQQGLFGKGWNTLFWNNHDMTRLVSRYGDEGKYHKKSAKMLATLMYLQWGVPFLLQGEEIGMTNAHFTKLSEYRDTSVPQLYEDLTKIYGCSEKEALAIIAEKSRDNSRTPMQWNQEQYAGFSTEEPWINVNKNYTHINVEENLADEDSIYYYYQKLLQYKKNDDVFVYGVFDLLLPDDPNIYAYTRTYEKVQHLIICNVSAAKVSCPLDYQHFTYFFGNDKPSMNHTLSPYEVRVLTRKI